MLGAILTRHRAERGGRREPAAPARSDGRRGREGLETTATPRTLRLNEADNVIIALDSVRDGAVLAEGVRAGRQIPRGHKIAVRAIAKGEAIRKFGQVIGFAATDIAVGDWVHEHNVELHEFARDYAFASEAKPDSGLLPGELPATFEGFRRADGRAGTRNYIGILSSVNCSATVADFIAEAVTRSGILADYPNIDGVIAFTHGTGCGMTSKGAEFDILARTQWGYASHPNFASVLLVGLGCEVFQISRLKKEHGIVEGQHFHKPNHPGKRGTRQLDRGRRREGLREMLAHAERRGLRETLPASELTLALQCGGSDGHSGITANPALGAAAGSIRRTPWRLPPSPLRGDAGDLRCRASAHPPRGRRGGLASKIVDLIRMVDQNTPPAPACNTGTSNPHPGNKAGGLHHHSRGSRSALVAKGGTGSPLRGVYRVCRAGRPQGLRRHGYARLRPGGGGYEPGRRRRRRPCASLLAAARPMAHKPTPSVKLASNSDLYRRMEEDMDIKYGDVLDGVSIEEGGLREIFQLVLDIASG